jgi:hypothetical protein
LANEKDRNYIIAYVSASLFAVAAFVVSRENAKRGYRYLETQRDDKPKKWFGVL